MFTPNKPTIHEGYEGDDYGVITNEYGDTRRVLLPEEYATTIKYDGGFVLVPRMGLGYSQAPREKKSQHTRSVGVTI